jgi:CRP-like cAMP-binding protein
MEGHFEFRKENVRIEKAIKASRMQIMLDALRLLDDGEIPKIGPPLLDQAAAVVDAAHGRDDKSDLPVIKGPMIDYMYVVEEEYFQDGQRVVMEGRHGSWIWIVLEGVAEIIRETSKGPMVIARLGEGSFIGTLTIFLFDGNIRSATVNAIGELRLGLLDTQRLYGEFTALSGEFRRILMSLSSRLIRITDKAAQLYTGEKKSIKLPQDKKALMKMGASQKETYLIERGEAYLVGKSKKGPVVYMSLGRDDYFGNLPFLKTGLEPEAAAVFGSQDIRLTKLGADRLHEEYERLSLTFRSLVNNACHCITLTTNVVNHSHGKE